MDSVHTTPKEITVTSPQGPMSLPWSEIVEARSYRLDAMAGQLTYVDLEHESGHVLEVRDDMQGWKEFLADLALRSGKSTEGLQEQLAGQGFDDEPIVLFGEDD